MLCKKCGSKVEDGAKFCPKCGNPIKVPIASVKKKGKNKNRNIGIAAIGLCICAFVIILVGIFSSGNGNGSEEQYAELTGTGICRKNYYNSEDELVYYETFAYCDNGVLCSSTLYSDEDPAYTVLYLHDADWELNDIVIAAFSDSQYNENNGKITIYNSITDKTISIKPEKESIEQKKFGIDSSKTEKIYGESPVISTDNTDGWVYEYLNEFFPEDTAESTGTISYKFIYVDGDSSMELVVEDEAGVSVYTVSEKSTSEKEKLELELDSSSGFYTDDAGWGIDSDLMEKGLSRFYDYTGISPYVYIINNIDGNYCPTTEQLEAFAEEQYSTLFSDSGHILLVFWDYGGYYEYTLWLGGSTGTIMDSTACDILFDYLDYYYYEAETDTGFFASAFEDAGRSIMSGAGDSINFIYGDTVELSREKNLVKTCSENDGIYSEQVYIIQDGKFFIIGSGEYSNIDRRFCWNNAEVTSEEYSQYLDDIYNVEDTMDFYSNVYSYNQCRLLLQSLATS